MSGIKTRALSRAAAFVVFSVLAWPLQAAFNADELAQLVRQGQAQAAYELAVRNLAEQEGDPLFDLYYGIAAIDTGHTSEGVFALERVLLVHPGNDYARLELARGYFILEEDVRARKEFSTVLKRNPPQNVKANIQRFLNAIRLREGRYKTTAGAYVEFALGHDTNVNSAPADANFFSPVFGVVTLDASSVENDDAFGVLTAGGRINHPVAPGRNLQFGADVALRYHDTEENFDTRLWNAQVAYNILSGKDQYRITGQVQKFDVNERGNRIMHALTGEWTRTLNAQLQVSAFGQAAALHYPGQTTRDSVMWTAGAGASRKLPGRLHPVVFGSVFAGREEPDNNTQAARAIAQRNFGGVRAGAQLTLAPRVSLTGSVVVQESHYGDANVLLGGTRTDKYYAANLGLKWLIRDHWSMRADVNYSRNDSNFAINDYERTQAMVSLRYDYF